MEAKIEISAKQMKKILARGLGKHNVESAERSRKTKQTFSGLSKEEEANFKALTR